MWIQFLSHKRLDVRGYSRDYYAGDWEDVGRQTALRLIAERAAHVPAFAAGRLLPAGCGVLAYGTRAAEAQRRLGPLQEHLGFAAGGAELSLPFERTVLWEVGLKLRAELLPAGLALLDVWEVACPLWDYDQLASRAGSAAERERTQAVVRDLRVPLYDPRLLFVRRCPATERLLAAWQAERAGWEECAAAERAGNDRLAFLRAFYAVKPLMLALPITWTNREARPGE